MRYHEKDAEHLEGQKPYNFNQQDSNHPHPGPKIRDHFLKDLVSTSSKHMKIDV